MLCRIADLAVEIPAAYGMDVRCRDYLASEKATSDIIINESEYKFEACQNMTPDNAAYMLSGCLFYKALLSYDGLMLHSSAVALDGKAYLFSGPCGMGKSTHTRLYKEIFGERACIFNDDKPALRKIDGIWYAYGTPWSGKHSINVNVKVPLAGICFLQRGEENKIRRLSPIEAVAGIASQTLNRFKNEAGMDAMLGVVEKLAADIPIFEFYSTPTKDAAILSYETMNAVSLGG